MSHRLFWIQSAHPYDQPANQCRSDSPLHPPLHALHQHVLRPLNSTVSTLLRDPNICLTLTPFATTVLSSYIALNVFTVSRWSNRDHTRWFRFNQPLHLAAFDIISWLINSGRFFLWLICRWEVPTLQRVPKLKKCCNVRRGDGFILLWLCLLAPIKRFWQKYFL